LYREIHRTANKDTWSRMLTYSDQYGAPIGTALLWTVLDPVSASIHSQALYIAVFGWIVSWWFKRRCLDIGLYLDNLGAKPEPNVIQLRVDGIYRVPKDQSSSIEANSFFIGCVSVPPNRWLLHPSPVAHCCLKPFDCKRCLVQEASPFPHLLVWSRFGTNRSADRPCPPTVAVYPDKPQQICTLLPPLGQGCRVEWFVRVYSIGGLLAVPCGPTCSLPQSDGL
jgi:hypothetical protein